MLHCASLLTATMCFRSLTKMQMEAFDFRQKRPKDMLVRINDARITAARQHDVYYAILAERGKLESGTTFVHSWCHDIANDVAP